MNAFRVHLHTRFVLAPVLLFVCSAVSPGQEGALRKEIQRILDQADGRVGVAIVGPGRRDTLTFNGDARFPMQSVYKFPLALAVLHRVDRGELSLDQKIHIRRDELLPGTWSPLRERYPLGDVDLTLDDLLGFTVSQSDNNGCDILFRLLGGTDVVDRYVHTLGIDGMAVVATEEEMHTGWDHQYRKWSSPRAMARLLSMFSQDSILSAASRDYLWRLMAATGTGPGRLRGGLPPGTVVAHKTGSSGVNESGIAAATNDAGIVVLPDGRQLVIVVFVSDSVAEENAREGVIADIARAAWNAYSNR